MTGLPRLSSRVYGGILLLYPADLRRDFGPDMNELFVEDLANAWRSRGFAGAIGVWWCAVCEVLRIAIPSQRTNPAIVVPAIAFALNTVIVGAELMLPMIHRTAPRPHDLLLMREIGQPLIWSGIAVALTALVVVQTGKVSLVSVPLDAADSAAEQA